MVDSFAELHPRAEERFTVWNQYQNTRQINAGSRLDYIFVDGQLWDACAPTAGTLDTGTVQRDYSDPPKKMQPLHDWQIASAINPDNRRWALSACTMSGRWQPAPSSGSGLPDGKPEEYLHHTMRKPHCGIVYTPPQWSDHVGVSLACSTMPIVQEEVALTSAEKRATRKCQPHRVQRSIASFFGKNPDKRSGAKASSISIKRSSGNSGGGGSSSVAVAPQPPKKKIKKSTRGFNALFGLQ
jgi:hypothetical protein